MRPALALAALLLVPCAAATLALQPETSPGCFVARGTLGTWELQTGQGTYYVDSQNTDGGDASHDSYWLYEESNGVYSGTGRGDLQRGGFSALFGDEAPCWNSPTPDRLIL